MPKVLPCKRSYLAAWRLGKPKSPFVSERVLDIEVVWIVEDGNDVVSVC